MNEQSTTSLDNASASASDGPRTKAVVSATDRYAALHRQLESGRHDDELLTQLITACIHLDKRDEAVQIFEQVQGLPLRRGLRRDLARRGWVSAQAPATEKQDLQVGTAEPDFAERYSDALQYLIDGQMPILAIGSTIAFPVVLVLGGMLAAIHDSLVFRGLAALPALLLVGVVATLGRRVLLAAMQSLQDGESLPAVPTLCRETPIVLAQLLATIGLLLGPAVLCVLLGSWGLALPLLALGIYPLPMTAALLFVTNDWRCLSPHRIVAAMRTGGAAYGKTWLAILPVALPAVVAVLLTAHLAVFSAMAVVGPLAAVPGWIAARMIGLFLHRQAVAFASWRLPTTTGAILPEPRWSSRPMAAVAAARPQRPAAIAPAAAPAARRDGTRPAGSEEPAPAPDGTAPDGTAR